MSERNPILLPPKPKSGALSCPKCKGSDYGGIKKYGSVTFKCRNKDCGNEWQGGLPREAYDPSLPRPPEPMPTIDYGANPQTGEIEEVRQRQSLTPEYRKGAFIDEDDEENY